VAKEALTKSLLSEVFEATPIYEVRHEMQSSYKTIRQLVDWLVS